MEVEAVQQEWNDLKNNIDSRIREHAIREKVIMVVKHDKFKEFEIQDTYLAWTKDACKDCRKGNRCFKHKYEK